MDSLTQIVLGVAVTHVGFANKISAKRTILFGAIVATLPDLDIYFAKLLNDPLAEVALHRGLSHAILFFIVLSAFISIFSHKWFRNITFKRLYLTTFFVLLTHALLDIFTTWGTQLLWWYPQKFALKSIFVVDVFYTIPLFIGLIYGLRKYKVRYTLVGLFISSCYLIWGLFAQQLVKKTVLDQFTAKYKESIENITVKPTFSNSVLWNVLVETKNGFYLTDRSLFDSDQMKFQFFPHQQHLIADYLSDANIQQLINISDNQFIITENSQGLIFNDLRFGLLKNDGEEVQFAFSYQLDTSTNPLKVKELPKARRDGKKLLLYIWNRIFNYQSNSY